jgi:hypothetical protein
MLFSVQRRGHFAAAPIHEIVCRFEPPDAFLLRLALAIDYSDAFTSQV